MYKCIQSLYYKLTQTHLKAHTNACKTHINTYPHKLCNNAYKRTQTHLKAHKNACKTHINTYPHKHTCVQKCTQTM